MKEREIRPLDLFARYQKLSLEDIKVFFLINHVLFTLIVRVVLQLKTVLHLKSLGLGMLNVINVDPYLHRPVHLSKSWMPIIRIVLLLIIGRKYFFLR